MRSPKDTVFVLRGNRLRVYRIICLVLVLLWMGAIFLFSSETADESAALSGSITERFARFFFRDWFLPANASVLSERLGKLEYLIRKSAHFTEYLILGGLLALFMSTIRMKYGFRIMISILVGILYAISDELHQSHVDGRAMQSFDVLIDSGGVMVGALVFSGISAMIVMDFVLRREKNSRG